MRRDMDCGVTPHSFCIILLIMDKQHEPKNRLLYQCHRLYRFS